MKLRPQPLTREAFAPFGEVIELPAETDAPMNAGRFVRTVGCATTDMQPPHPARIDMVRCTETTELSSPVQTLECHPRGSQAFVPLSGFRFIVVVAPAGPEPAAADVRAFVTDGRQGISYRRGTWHLPMIARAGQTFLVVERDEDTGNCESMHFDPPLTLLAPA